MPDALTSWPTLYDWMPSAVDNHRIDCMLAVADAVAALNRHFGDSQGRAHGSPDGYEYEAPSDRIAVPVPETGKVRR